MNENMVYLKDVMGDKKELMETIKNGNVELYDVIMEFYRNDSRTGIPLNILDYAAEHVDDFQKNAKFAKNVVPLFFKDGMTVEHLAYLNSYYAVDNPLLDISDFCVLMDISLEKPISLPNFKKFVSENDDNIDVLSSLVIDYSIDDSANDSVDDSADGAASVPVCADENEDTEVGTNNSVEDVMTSIVNVVCRRDEKGAELALEAQNQINNTVGQFQRTSTDFVGQLQSFSTDIVNSFNRLISDKTEDKAEIERLKSVIVLQQQTLNKKDTTIADLNNQIDALKEKLCKAEKVAQEYDDMRSKLSELNLF